MPSRSSQFKGRRLLLVTTLIVMLIPNTALVLPIFLELSAVRLIGNPLAVILPFSFFPFGVYLTYIYFSTAVSRDLLNAARIDGAGELRVFTQCRDAARHSGDRAGRLLQLRRQLEQLLPAVPRRRRAEDPGAGRASPTCSRTCRPSTRRLVEHRHPAAHAGARDAAVGGADPDHLPLRPAFPRRGHDRRGDARNEVTGYRTLSTRHHWQRPSATSTDTSSDAVTEVPILILETDEGVDGVGIGSHADLDRLFPAIVGEDPRAVAALFDRMLAAVFKSGHSGATYGGIGDDRRRALGHQGEARGRAAVAPARRTRPLRARRYASGLDIALSDDEIADVLRRVRRPRIRRRQAQGRPGSGCRPAAAAGARRASSAATRRSPGSCSTPTSRGRSSRPSAT